MINGPVPLPRTATSVAPPGNRGGQEPDLRGQRPPGPHRHGEGSNSFGKTAHSCGLSLAGPQRGPLERGWSMVRGTAMSLMREHIQPHRAEIPPGLIKDGGQRLPNVDPRFTPRLQVLAWRETGTSPKRGRDDPRALCANGAAGRRPRAWAPENAAPPKVTGPLPRWRRKPVPANSRRGPKVMQKGGFDARWVAPALPTGQGPDPSRKARAEGGSARRRAVPGWPPRVISLRPPGHGRDPPPRTSEEG